MRQRKAHEDKVLQYIQFLQTVQLRPQDKGNQLSLTDIAARHQVTKSAPAALIELGIIKKKSKYVWEWTTEYEPSKNMALNVLDRLLHRSKKQVVTPIAGFEAMATQLTGVLNTFIEKLNTISVQNERALKAPKIASNGDGDLFRVDSDLLYLVGQMASNVDYINLSVSEIDATNVKIINSSFDLLFKLRNKK